VAPVVGPLDGIVSPVHDATPLVAPVVGPIDGIVSPVHDVAPVVGPIDGVVAPVVDDVTPIVAPVVGPLDGIVSPVHDATPLVAPVSNMIAPAVSVPAPDTGVSAPSSQPLAAPARATACAPGAICEIVAPDGPLTLKSATGAPSGFPVRATERLTVPAPANQNQTSFIDAVTADLRASAGAAASVFGEQEFAGAAIAASLLTLVRVFSGGQTAAGSSAASASQAPVTSSRAPSGSGGISWQACLDAAMVRIGALLFSRITWPTGPRFSMEYAPVPPPP
jgi:hypothetical protein